MECETLPSVVGFNGIDPSLLQAVDYESTLLTLDPTAAPEKQAKVALDQAIGSGNIEQLQMVWGKITQHLPSEAATLMMHALRSVARCGNHGMMQHLLAQLAGCQPGELFNFLTYVLDGAAEQDNTDMMEYSLREAEKAFCQSYPQQFHELVQHAVNTAARHGKLRALKCLIDQTAAAAIPIDYRTAVLQAASSGQAETLIKDAIKGGAAFESIILMLLQALPVLPDTAGGGLGSRHSVKTAAKLQLVKSYKQSNPALFAHLMAAVKRFFPEESATSAGAADGDVTM